MDYELQLLKEHSRANTDIITKTIGNAPDEFKKIIDIIYKEKIQLSQRASWLLATVNDKHPELLKPYLPIFINTIKDFKIDAVKRNMLLVLAAHPISEKLQGKLVNICFDFILSPDEPVAVKVYAMQCIVNVATKHPELGMELKAAIEDQLPKTTAAFHARAKAVLKKLN